MSAFAMRPVSSFGVENVLSGRVTAPMRAAANHPTTNDAPFG